MLTVYIIQAGDVGPVMIGVADHRRVRRHVARVQQGNAELVHVRKLLDGDERLLAKIAADWEPWRVRGDWYRAEALEREPPTAMELPADVRHTLVDDMDDEQRRALDELGD